MQVEGDLEERQHPESEADSQAGQESRMAEIF